MKVKRLMKMFKAPVLACLLLNLANLPVMAVEYPTKDPIFDCMTFYNFSIPGVTPLAEPEFHINLNMANWVLNQQWTRGGITVVYLLRPTGPFDGAGYDGKHGKETLGLVMDYVNANRGYINYVLADFEQETEIENTREMVRQVRAHPNPQINTAFVGNYGWTTATTSVWDWIVPSRNLHIYKSYAYTQSGVNVSQPVLYTTSKFKLHYTQSGPGRIFNGNACVSLPHAAVWAPLELFSAAKRGLIPGHKMIAWITGFLDNDASILPPYVMTKNDNRVIVQHARLRGLDGYLTYWDNTCSNYPTQNELRDDMYANGWKPLNAFFDIPGDTQVLNLTTNKTGGVEWSGVRRGDECMFLFSNFTDRAVQIDLPRIEGLPEKSPEIPAASATEGQHLLVNYKLKTLQAYWKMNENSGTAANDSTDGHHNGRLTSCYWTPGKFDSSLGFESPSSMTVVDDSPGLDLPEKVSITAWIYPTAYSGVDTYPIGKIMNASDANYAMCFGGDTGTNSKKIVFYAKAGGTWQAVSPVSSVLELNKWHHIAWTYSSTGGGKLYINGTSQGAPAGSGLLSVNDADFIIGGGFRGKVDEVKIYSSVLSEQKVIDEYACALNAGFNDATGTVVADSSIFGNNGSLSGATWCEGLIQFGGALSFDTGNTVVFPNSPNLNLTDEISIDAWFYPTAYDTGFASYPISKAGSDADANFKMCFFGTGAGTNNKRIAFYANAGGAFKAVSPSYAIENLNTWYHIGWTYSTENGGQLFINGVSQGNAVRNAGLLTLNTADVVVGGGFKGKIDEVKIYNKDISKPEFYARAPDVTGPVKMPDSSSKCDLIVNKVWWDGQVVAGNPLTVKFQISNIGTAKTMSGANKQMANVYINKMKVVSVEYNDINPKGSVILNATIEGKYIKAGEQTEILVMADAKYRIIEIKESNNTKSASFFIENRPDLVVKEISLSPSPKAGRPLTVNFKISNIGAGNTVAGSGRQAADVYVDGAKVGTVNYDDLAKGAIITKQWNIPAGLSAGIHKFKVVVDAGNVVSEKNENNNFLEKRFTVAR